MTDPWSQHYPPSRDRGQADPNAVWHARTPNLPAQASPQGHQAQQSYPSHQSHLVHQGHPAHAAGADPLLVTIGDIGITQHWVITPNGTRPIGEVQWVFADNTRTTERMPAYAIVLAVVFFLVCLLGLLFLLIKERRTEGYVQVTVQGAGLYHATQIPVSSAHEIAHLHNLVGYARSVTAHAGTR